MGAGQSVISPSQPSEALHVLRVTPDSPASRTDIEPLFDFIVGCDSLEDSNIDAAQLQRVVASFEGKPLNLVVWSSKNRELREVTITPSRDWSEDPFEASLLGLTMRMCEPEFSLDVVWHVLEVLEGSPAESAGLVPYGDYIVGYAGGLLKGEDEFYELVEQNVDRPLRVYVYSADFGNLREVVLIPNRHWGGEGLLGCVFGFGLLHRIPVDAGNRSLGVPVQEEEEEEQTEYDEADLFVPADSVEPESDEHTLARQRREDDAWKKERESVAEQHHGHSHSSHSHSHDHGGHSNHDDEPNNNVHTTPRRADAATPTPGPRTNNGFNFLGSGRRSSNGPPLSTSSSSGNEGDRDSVAETESTEANSLGSLTSVD